MSEYQSLEAIYDGMVEYGTGIYHPERRPVALMLLGRSQDAARQLASEVEALGERADPAAENFRRFAAALWAELATLSRRRARRSADAALCARLALARRDEPRFVGATRRSVLRIGTLMVAMKSDIA